MFAVLSVLVGIPAIAMFWTQNEKMLHFGIAYGAVSSIGEIWKAYISSDIVASFMESVPGGADYSWIAKTSVLTSGICGIVFIALAIVLHNMYHNLNEMPESGFYLKVDNPASPIPNMEIMTSNTETIPGFKITKSLGVATGSTVRAKHIGKDILAGFKNIVGGEIKAYTELLMEARTEALGRMMLDAAQRGGNAVVNVRFATSSVAGGQQNYSPMEPQ